MVWLKKRPGKGKSISSSIVCLYKGTQTANLQCIQNILIFPFRVSGGGYKIGLVCLCVRLLVSTPMAELFDIQTQNLV